MQRKLMKQRVWAFARGAAALAAQARWSTTPAVRDLYEEVQREVRCSTVPARQSILNVLLAEGVSVPRSCSDAVRGSCETAVLEGTPEHLDLLLSPAERSSGKTRLVSCARAAGEPLVLDT